MKNYTMQRLKRVMPELIKFNYYGEMDKWTWSHHIPDFSPKRYTVTNLVVHSFYDDLEEEEYIVVCRKWVFGRKYVLLF